ncbi:MAG: HPP family protein [Phycisphaerales bacterium]
MSATTPRTRVAKDIMASEPVCIDLGMTVRAVARIFEENEISGAPVVDSGGRLVGVVSRTDLVRRYTNGDIDRDPTMLIELFGGDDPGAELMSSQLVTIDDFMTPDPITARPHTPIADIAHRMVDARVHRIIIVDPENIPVGIITSLDLVKALSAPLAAH